MFTWIANLNVTDWKPPKKCTAFFLHCATLPLEIESAKKGRKSLLFCSFYAFMLVYKTFASLSSFHFVSG